MATAPVKEVVARIMSWEPSRWSELLVLLRRARQRKLGSDENGRAVRGHPWQYRTSPEQHAEIIELAKTGVGTCEIARRTGVKRQTVYSIIRAGK